MQLPANLVKINWFFELGKYGWSTVWYMIQAGTTSNSSASLALQAVAPMSDLYAAILHPAAALIARRASDESLFGDSAVNFTVFPGTAPVGLTADADLSPVAALYRGIDTSRTYRRSVWFHGLPDSWGHLGEPTSVMIEATDQAKAVNAWVQQAALIGLGMLVVNKAVPPASVFTIKNFAASTLAGYTTVTMDANAYTEGTSVQIQHARWTHPELLPKNFKPNGVWTITNPTATTFDIPMSFPTLSLQSVYTGTGQVHARTLLFAPLANLIWERYATRRTGRAFFVPRGRRSVKR
jgi:hypothetical protein